MIIIMDIIDKIMVIFVTIAIMVKSLHCLYTQAALKSKDPDTHLRLTCSLSTNDQNEQNQYYCV